MALTGWTFIPGPFSAPIGADKYTEMYEDSGDAMFSEEVSEAHRIFLVDWGERIDFLGDLLGSSDFGGTSGVTRVVPEEHPDYPAFYAVSAKIKPYGVPTVSGTKSQWCLAAIDTVFRPVDYTVAEDSEFDPDELYRFVSRKTTPKADFLQLAVGAFKWVSRAAPNNVLGATPGIIVPARTLEYTWHLVPSTTTPFRIPNEATLLNLLGKANSGTFDSIYPRGTVLFVGADAQICRPRFDGAHHWTIKYYFEVKDHGVALTGERAGVNYIFDPAFNRWDLVTSGANAGLAAGNRLYQEGNLNTLFSI